MDELARLIPAKADLTQHLNITNAAVSGTPGTASQIATGDPSTKGLIFKGNTFQPSSVTPTSVSGLQGWWKADALVGFNDGDQVATFTDSSGNGNNATGGTNPKYKTNQINGLPALWFDATGGTQANKRTTISISQPYTIFGVVRRVSATADQYWCSDAAVNMASYTLATSGKYSIYAGATLSEASATSGWTIVEAVYNGASSTMYINGTAAVTGNAGSGAISQFRISQASPSAWDGYIAEVILYSGTLSTANRQGVEVYLANKYNLTTSSQTPQASNLLECENSTGTALSGFDGSGRLVNLTSAGTPTGTPTTGAMVYDTTNNKLYVYNGGWKSVTLA